MEAGAEGKTPGQALELKIFTWGSCRRGHVYVIDVESGRRYNLADYTQKSGEGELRLPFLRGRFVNEDSRKNLRRTVWIHGSTRPAVVWYTGRGSCNPKSAFSEAWLVAGSAITPLEVRRGVSEEVVDNGSEKYRAVFDVVYVETPYGRVVLDKVFRQRAETLEVVKIPVEVAYSSSKRRLAVAGKTYYIREELKKRGFRWDGVYQYWYVDNIGEEEARRLVEWLKGVDKVAIEREVWL
jgi:hypothetical protein